MALSLSQSYICVTLTMVWGQRLQIWDMININVWWKQTSAPLIPRAVHKRYKFKSDVADVIQHRCFKSTVCSRRVTENTGVIYFRQQSLMGTSVRFRFIDLALTSLPLLFSVYFQIISLLYVLNIKLVWSCFVVKTHLPQIYCRYCFKSHQANTGHHWSFAHTVYAWANSGQQWLWCALVSFLCRLLLDFIAVFHFCYNGCRRSVLEE